MDDNTRKKHWKVFREMSDDELVIRSDELCDKMRHLETDFRERRREYNKEKKNINKSLATRPLPFVCNETRDNKLKAHLNKIESELGELKQKIYDHETMRRDCLRRLAWNRGGDIIFERYKL